jgi:hypothetical protein
MVKKRDKVFLELQNARKKIETLKDESIVIAQEQVIVDLENSFNDINQNLVLIFEELENGKIEIIENALARV